MSTLKTGWLSSAAVSLLSLLMTAFGFVTAGCGPAPGYEAQAQVPVGYSSVPQEPVSSEELAARPPPPAAPAAVASNGDVALGENADEYADNDPSALTEFRPALEGHGQWVDDGTYGTVWVPAQAEVGTDFEPYVSAGHWTYSDTESWVWVSDYSWGWAPFHYGRWVLLPGYGWSWIPGRRYAGAWVVWRTGPVGYEYVGWAPAAPDWYWYNGYAIGWTFGWYHPHYVYCAHSYLYRPYVGSYVVRGPSAAPIEARTRPYVAAAPSVGRTPASPSVGAGGAGSASGRGVASPSVGKSAAMGPRPDELGIKRTMVTPPPSDHRGLERAHAFATPKPPEPRVADARPVAAAPSPYLSSRVTPAARSPQVAGVAPVAPRQPSYTDPRPVPRSITPSESPSARWSPPVASSPTPSAPTYRSSPSMASPSGATPTPYYRSSPSMTSPSAPTYRSSPSAPVARTPSVSTPTYRSSPSSSTFHAPSVSSPSHSSPSFRSSPSVSTPRPSTPSHSSSPSRSSSPRRR